MNFVGASQLCLNEVKTLSVRALLSRLSKLHALKGSRPISACGRVRAEIGEVLAALASLFGERMTAAALALIDEKKITKFEVVPEANNSTQKVTQRFFRIRRSANNVTIGLGKRRQTADAECDRSGDKSEEFYIITALTGDDDRIRTPTCQCLYWQNCRLRGISSAGRANEVAVRDDGGLAFSHFCKHSLAVLLVEHMDQCISGGTGNTEQEQTRYAFGGENELYDREVRLKSEEAASKVLERSFRAIIVGLEQSNV